MEVKPLALDGLLLCESRVHRDERGFFVERYHVERFQALGLRRPFVQDNHSHSLPRVLRGLHYQYDPPQGKLISVIRGTIWDVAVDIRPTSPTYGKSLGIELTADSGRALWIPAGFAHGLCVLGDEPADVLYKVDALYHAGGESGLAWADPDLAVAWPVQDPIVSARDRALPSFAAYRANPVAW